MNKKLLSKATYFLGFAWLTVPGTANAFSIVNNPDPAHTSLETIVHVLVRVIGFMWAFAGAIAVIFVLVNGYQYIFSAGNPEKVEKAKQGLTWSITGFILAISGFAVVYLLQLVLRSKHTVAETITQTEAPTRAATVIEDIAQLFWVFAAAVAVFYLVLGGYRYMTSQGNQESIEKAKLTILYSVIGLIVIISAAAIFKLIQQGIGA